MFNYLIATVIVGGLLFWPIYPAFAFKQARIASCFDDDVTVRVFHSVEGGTGALLGRATIPANGTVSMEIASLSGTDNQIVAVASPVSDELETYVIGPGLLHDGWGLRAWPKIRVGPVESCQAIIPASTNHVRW